MGVFEAKASSVKATPPAASAKFTDIVNEQRPTGVWRESLARFTTAGTLAQLRADNPALSALADDAFLTVCGLACLEQWFGNDKKAWQLVARKGVKALKDILGVAEEAAALVSQMRVKVVGH